MGNTTDGERWVSQAKIDEAAVLNRLGEALVALRPLEQATFCRVTRQGGVVEPIGWWRSGAQLPPTPAGLVAGAGRGACRASSVAGAGRLPVPRPAPEGGAKPQFQQRFL